MTDLYLGLIALGVLVMAAIQVAAIVAALRTARRVGELASRFEQDVRPIIVNLQKVSEEAARASAQAAAQVDRLDALVGAVARRVEETDLDEGRRAAWHAGRQGMGSTAP